MKYLRIVKFAAIGRSMMKIAEAAHRQGMADVCKAASKSAARNFKQAKLLRAHISRERHVR